MNHIDIPGFIESSQEVKVIEMLSSMVPENGTIVEVGSHFGKTAVMWSTFSKPSVTVYAIDHWRNESNYYKQRSKIIKQKNIMDNIPSTLEWCYSNRYQTFLYYTKDHPNIIPIISDSPPVDNRLDFLNDIDFIFLDSDMYDSDIVDREFEFWFPRLKKEGILCRESYYIENQKQFHYYSDAVKISTDKKIQEYNLPHITRPYDTDLSLIFKSQSTYEKFVDLYPDCEF